MIRSLFVTILVLSIAVAGDLFVISRVSRAREVIRKEEISLLLPAPIAKVVAQEFKGLLSDVLFSKAMTYYGGKLIRKENTSDAEWDWIYRSMDLATDLDPYFLDPYYFGAMNLSWGAGKIKEADSLLEKANRYRTWDWTIPFYLGFNYFYFLQDNDKASEYLMDASKRPGAITVVSSLAAKLAYKERKTENAIMFLQELLKKTDDETFRKQYMTRIQALTSTIHLEKAVTAYKNKFHKAPVTIEDLLKKGILKELPIDPYGGTFYLDAEGRVGSTSNLITLYTHT